MVVDSTWHYLTNIENKNSNITIKSIFVTGSPDFIGLNMVLGLLEDKVKNILDRNISL